MASSLELVSLTALPLRGLSSLKFISSLALPSPSLGLSPPFALHSLAAAAGRAAAPFVLSSPSPLPAPFFSRTVGHKLTLSELQTTEGWISMRYWSRLEKEHLVLHCWWGTSWRRRSEPDLLFFSYMGQAVFCSVILLCKVYLAGMCSRRFDLRDKRTELAGLHIRRLDSST